AVEDNECWGNGSSGIALQRDERSPDAASHARLTGNRCHDNMQSGIALVSSDSEAVEDNECWGNGSSGIALQRAERSLDAASHAWLTGNRCHDNARAGYAIDAGGEVDIAEDNQAYRNGEASVTIDPSGRKVQDISWPFVEADESPAETQTRLRAGAASGALAARLADCVSLPDSDALARFLYGSGSLFDLKRLLDAKNTQETDSSAEIAAESVVYTLDRNRPSATDEKTVYRFQQTGTAGLRRVVWDKVAAHVISDRPSAWLIGAFGDAGGEIEQIVEDAVQANGVNVDAFAPGEAIPTGRLDLLRALQIGSARIVPPLVVSCNGRSEQAQIKEQPEAPFLEPPPVLGWRGWIARLGFVLRTPTYLLTLIGLLAASFVVAVAVGAWKRYPDPLADPVTLALEAVFSNIDDIQLSDILMLCAVTAGTIMAGLVAFANRFLPWHLQFRPRQRKEDGAGSPPQRERPWHRWINRRLFRKNAVSLVFLRDLREWPEDDRAALQSIFENRPKDTSLIVVVDCPTRSALDRSLLFPLDAPGGGPAAEMTNVEVIACLGNEPGFITEHAATTPEAQQRLLGIFGDRAATRLEQIRGDILSEEYLPGDLLPMICIGYSHYFPFSLRHRSTTAATRHSEEVRKTLDRYVTLYSGGAQRSATWLSENAPLQQWIDEAREASCTRLFLKRKGRQESYSVYGRFQLRSEMASLVSAVFENDQPGLTDYVRAMLRCGELQAISAAIEALEAENGKIMHPNRALAAIKGALFLRDEHKGRGENSTDTDRKRAEIVDAMWEQLCRLIDLLPVAPDDPDLFLQAQLYSASLHARHPLPSVSAVLEADKGGAANFARLLSKAKLRFQNSDRKLASNLAQSDLRSMMALALDAFSGSVDRALTRASFKAKSLAELIDGADGREDLIAVCGRHRSLGPELLATVLSNAVRNAKTDEDRIELALVLDANLPLLGALRDVDRPRGYTDMKNENLSTYIDLLAAPALRDMCQSDGMSAGYVSMVELMFGSTGHLFGTERQTDRVEFWANPSMSYSISL
ncbi:MAG: right-handed parallel beta-helix repeat-containing protein, partial [Pseudomonadota bacterium]